MAMQSTSKSDILAEATLTELIDNNKIVLEKKIKKQTITTFISLLFNNEAHEKYVKLLRALSTCNGSAMLNNQADISRAVFDDPQIKSTLIFPVYLKNGEIFITLNLANQAEDEEEINLESSQLMISSQKPGRKTYQTNEVISLLKFQSNPNKADIFNYFIAFTNLLADLCLERNYLAIDPL